MRKKPKKEVMPWRQGVLSHHQRGSMKRGDATKVTWEVRQEVNRRSMELRGTDIPCCEKCGTTKNLTKAHIVNASQGGLGYDPANIMNLCGTHGLTDTCHHKSDNSYTGRQWKKQYGAMLRLYYSEGNGKNYWSYKEEA
jgi:hypothetical protein